MIKYLPLILFTVFTNALAQIMLKKGMSSLGTFEFDARGIISVMPRLVLNGFVVGGLTVFAISACSHLLVLSRVELSFAYPFLSLAYVVVAIYAYFVFQENLGYYRIMGIALICLGTALIARS